MGTIHLGFEGVDAAQITARSLCYKYVDAEFHFDA